MDVNFKPVLNHLRRGSESSLLTSKRGVYCFRRSLSSGTVTQTPCRCRHFITKETVTQTNSVRRILLLTSRSPADTEFISHANTTKAVSILLSLSRRTECKTRACVCVCVSERGEKNVSNKVISFSSSLFLLQTHVAHSAR